MRKEFRIGGVFPRENVVVMEFTRDDLENIIYAFGPSDTFVDEVREGMRLLDEAVLEQQSFYCAYGKTHLESDGCDCYM